MTSVWNSLIALLWKCIILRKRNWLLTIFELISPILVVFLIWCVKKKISEAGLKDTSKGNVNFDYFRTKHPSDYELISSLRNIYSNSLSVTHHTFLCYAPKTIFTDQIMSTYKSSADQPNQRVSLEAKISEEELVAALIKNSMPNSTYSCVLGVVFYEQRMSFKYKILGNFDESLKRVWRPCTNSMIFKLQVYIDAQFLKRMGIRYDRTKVLIQEFVHGGNVSQRSEDNGKEEEGYESYYIFPLYIFLTLVYIFLVAAVVRDTIQEKSSGIKELMRIMGLSSWMIWIHWFIYSMLVQIPVTMANTALLTLIPPRVFEANAFIVWLLFLLVTIDYIVIFFLVTCFFDGATKATSLCIIFWMIINLALMVVISPRSHSLLGQVLISLVPLVNLCWNIQSLDSFHNKKVDWNPSYLFTKGFSGSNIPVGGGIAIFVCEIIVFSLLLAYFDAVKPGRYGVAKPVGFMCGYCVKLWRSREEPADSETSSLPSEFELPTPGTKVGIEIRGLHKEFGLFKRVVAVESVNLDIYEGEVTVLLGHNGAGKTTTMSMITGMFSPTSGTVSVDGKNIYENLHNFRQNLGLCTQHNLYFPKLTVLEHLMFFGMLKGRTYSQAREEGKYLLYMLNLIDKKDLTGSKLSGGMLRRLCLAVALTGGAKVLILDEPTSGLDPENRRYIWDIILSLRGERTILITTHYMEEADVLGDRIAIMDRGKVMCCGTPMFLKKLYGTGYNIHISKDPNASLKDITTCVRGHIHSFETKIVSPFQVDFTIKDEFVNIFPKLFATLENLTDSLGVKAMSVSCTTMEDVFLRVAELSERKDQDIDEQKASNLLRGDFIKVQGVQLIVQQVEASFVKHAKYISNNLVILLIKLIIAGLLVLSVTLIINFLKTEDYKESKNSGAGREIRLKLYPDSIYPIIYDEVNTKTAEVAQTIIKSTKGQSFMMKLENSSKNASFDTMHQLLAKMAESTNTNKKVYITSTFIENTYLIQYQPDFSSFAASIAANLMANILLKRVQPDKSVEILSQPLRSTDKKCDLGGALRFICTVFVLIIFIPFALTIVMTDVVPFTIEERVTGFKYQQIIAGVSPMIFWLTSLLANLSLYLVFVISSVVIILLFGRDVIPWNSENMIILNLVLILYGVSSIIFLYAFTYILNSSAKITGLYLVLNFSLMFVCPILRLILDFNEKLYIQILVTAVLSLHPSAAGFFALYSVANGIANSSVCPLNEIQSYLGIPTSSNRNSIFIYVLFFVLDIVLYSCVVFLIDCKVYERLLYKRIGINDCQEGDDDVKLETNRVRMYKQENVDTAPLRVEGLVKNYGLLRAANQVSFLVTRGECFGLLGVNGAGKTSTFKMLTGEVFPSSGDAFSTKYSVVSQTRKYLSNIGYCPQFNALVDDFTGNDSLKIIAKMRGVPRKEVRHQVDYWMSTLGITEHAAKRTHKYSGGTKRKLCTAMAFIGEPLVTLLDEPTTGVDPAARRKVWSAVKNCQSSGYSVVLSSHSMEECEALCTRLTIMRNGELRCIGSVQELKTKFGQGFLVLLKLSTTELYRAHQLELLKREFQRAFPKSDIQDENTHMITFRVLDDKIKLSWIFSEVIRFKQEYEIVDDFIVSNSSLEQLFLAIAREQVLNPVTSIGLSQSK